MVILSWRVLTIRDFLIRGPAQYVKFLYAHSYLSAPQIFKSIFSTNIKKIHIERAYDIIQYLNCVMEK